MDVQLWFPVVTLLVGLGAGYLIDWHREKRTATRERRERRNAFQRDTIVEAQDLLWTLFQSYWQARGTAQVEDGEELLGTRNVVLRTEAMAITMRLEVLASRMDNTELKALLHEFRAVVLHIRRSKDDASFESALDATFEAMERFNGSAGTVLAELH